MFPLVSFNLWITKQTDIHQKGTFLVESILKEIIFQTISMIFTTHRPYLLPTTG